MRVVAAPGQGMQVSWWWEKVSVRLGIYVGNN